MLTFNELPFLPPVFPFASFDYGLIMPARCQAHGVDSHVACASHDFTAVEREVAVRVLRCDSHAAESPLECYVVQANGGPLYRGRDPWRAFPPSHDAYAHQER